jgi:hypothetical protein
MTRVGSQRHRGKKRGGGNMCLACGTRWHSWLRHCATSQKFVDSILVFRLLNRTGRSMALSSTRPVTETSTTGISLR